MMWHDREKEFQIRLAELQADIQIYVTSCFGVIAMLFTILIGLDQIYFGLPSQQSIVGLSIIVGIVVFTVIGFIVIFRLARKIEVARKQISELRKEFCM